jgi:hypothetical protein
MLQSSKTHKTVLAPERQVKKVSYACRRRLHASADSHPAGDRFAEGYVIQADSDEVARVTITPDPEHIRPLEYYDTLLLHYRSIIEDRTQQPYMEAHVELAAEDTIATLVVTFCEKPAIPDFIPPQKTRYVRFVQQELSA